MAIVFSVFKALNPPLVTQSVEHFRQQGSKAAYQRWVGENLQERTEERNQAHFFLSL